MRVLLVAVRARDMALRRKTLGGLDVALQLRRPALASVVGAAVARRRRRASFGGVR